MAHYKLVYDAFSVVCYFVRDLLSEGVGERDYLLQKSSIIGRTLMNYRLLPQKRTGTL